MGTEAIDIPLRRTPLYDAHCKLGGKIVPFAGWELPVQYSGLIAEHVAVRTEAGLFDVSHMGEIFFEGPEAEQALNFLTCNNVTSLYDGKAQYSAIPNERGGVVDDIIIYRFSKTRFLVCVNASNAGRDYEWFTAHNTFEVSIVNRSEEFGQIALQGPKAVALASRLPGFEPCREIQPFHFADTKIADIPVIAARTGYTGEDGFEFFVPRDLTEKLWYMILELGGVTPCGLGARDTLRLEAAYPLHGHELGPEISAIDSGLAWIVKPDKESDFIGKAQLAREMQEGSPRALIGFLLDDAGIARHGDLIFSGDGEEIGWVTSGTKTPTVNKALGLGIIKRSLSAHNTKMQVSVRGRKLAGHVVRTPFYKREKLSKG